MSNNPYTRSLVSVEENTLGVDAWEQATKAADELLAAIPAGSDLNKLDTTGNPISGDARTYLALFFLRVPDAHADLMTWFATWN